MIGSKKKTDPKEVSAHVSLNSAEINDKPASGSINISLDQLHFSSF